jgi:hypothetical protein
MKDKANSSSGEVYDVCRVPFCPECEPEAHKDLADYQDSRNHTCEYVIPVEWENMIKDVGGRPMIVSKKAVKLACACGSERER